MLEMEMMKNYQKLNLLVGVMDKGVVEHMGHFNQKTSLRLSYGIEQFPMIKIKNVEEETRYLL